MRRVRRITTVADIMGASALLDRLATQEDGECVVPPGLHDYKTRRFVTSLCHTLTADPTATTFLADAAFIWGAIILGPHNRCMSMAGEKMLVADWDSNTMDRGRVLHAFEAWAQDQDTSAVSVSIPLHSTVDGKSSCGARASCPWRRPM